MPRGRPRRAIGTKRAGLKRQVMKLKHKVLKLDVAREIKELTALPHNTYGNYTNAGDARDMTQIIQGDDYNQRVGRQIVPTSLAIDFYLRGPQSNNGVAGTFNAPVNPVPWRIIVFQDMSYNGTVRPLADILEATNATINTYDNYVSGYNDDFVKVGKHSKDNPVRILFDRKGWFVGTASGYSSHIGQWVKCRVSGQKLKTISYNGTAANTNRSGSLFYYILLGPDTTALNNGSYVVRHTLRYYDD